MNFMNRYSIYIFSHLIAIVEFDIKLVSELQMILEQDAGNTHRAITKDAA